MGKLGIELTPGIDEVSLTLSADAWSRTYCSRAYTFASAAGALESRNGIRILPDKIVNGWPAESRLPPIDDRPPAQALDQTLRSIQSRYGRRTGAIVATQLEYSRKPVER